MSTDYADTETDLCDEIQDLKTAQAVQEATDARAHATQAAVQAGDTAAQTAAHAGTWSTMVAGAAMFIVGIFMALAFVAVARD